ncbi:Slit 1 protein [Folsomia candida]|uniref:Slit 1 protein n=1 Tax=Folsomia candida TaxID=158441 RepID=A0A226E139_FOLCA|nr:Slit 1 protein [Folsomia candida]
MGRKELPSSSTTTPIMLTPIPTFRLIDSPEKERSRRRKPQMSFQQRNLNHVFTFPLLIPVVVATLLLFIIRPGSGLHPPQCQWDLYQDIERLKCNVDPGNTLIVEEEVHGAGPEHAKSLWVQCSDNVHTTSGSVDNKQLGGGDDGEEELQVDSYFGSEKTSLKVAGGDTGGGFVLSHGVFMAVPNLRDLRLENCRIAGITPGALGYLPYLQNFTLRAHTSHSPWSSSSHVRSSSPAMLEIKPGVLRGLPELRHLDLSTTSLSSLPNDFLCFLPSLNYLNLTGSGLRDFRSIGIQIQDPTNPHNCANQMRILDLSNNHFNLLPPATFSTVSRLEELRIDGNSITSASERALLGLNHLKIFSAAGNQLSSLQPEFFKDNRQLQEIYLQKNQLSVLAPGLLTGLEQLVVVDLSSNELTSEWVIGETFRGLVRLVILRLDNNKLTRIDSVLFRDLYSLQVLSLENNMISTVTEDAFSGMYNIHTLLLSHNQLKVIDTFICNGLGVLSFLALDNNKIETVGVDSFKNCSNVMDLNFSGNKLTQVPEAIGALNLIKTLDLGENKITDISNASFASLPNLYGLRLTDNLIGHIPKDALSNLPSLKIANFAKNKISSIEQKAFDNNPNLQALRVDNNAIKGMFGLFKNIPNLLWLNISGNKLEELDYKEFPPRIQWVDLRSNMISKLGTCLEIDNLRIRNLDISHNLITEIGQSNLPDSIENLIMSHNRIHQVQPYTFFRKPNITRVDLSNNKLERLSENALRLSSGADGGVKPIAEILLGHNPLICDCTLPWLRDMNSGETSGQYPNIMDVEDVKCTLLFDRGNDPVPFMDIAPSQYLCKYESHCFSLCSCCDFDHCDCQMSCPKNCSCFHDAEWNTNLVDCSRMEESSIPSKIPIDVTQLHLDGNVFPVLQSHSFIGRKNMEALYLNFSHIEKIQNRSFHGLKALRVLHLENNFIERLDGFEFDDLDDLEELYLHQNSISFISNQTFASMVALKFLTLHGNSLVDLAIWEVVLRGGGRGIGGHLIPSSSDTHITLRGNEFSCECQFATQLKDWLMENSAKISDANQVHCVDQVSTSASLSPSNKQSSFSSNSALVPLSPSSSGSVSSSGGGSSSSGKSATELIVVRLLDQRNHRCSQSTDLSIREPTTRSGDEFEWSVYVPVIVISIGLLLLVCLVSIVW